MTMDPIVKIAAARWWAIGECPYFATALFALTPKEVPKEAVYGMATIAVTRTGVLLYTREAVSAWSSEELGAALIHEVLHILRDHWRRAQEMGAEPRQWNVAADLEINDDVRDMRLKLPVEGLFPDTTFNLPVGLTAEEYYNLLNSPENQKKLGKTPRGFAAGACGEIAGNPTGREPPDDPDEGKTEAQMQNIANQTAAAVREHAQGRGAGNVPGGLLRWANGKLAPPVIPWQQQLRQTVKHALRDVAGNTHQTYTKIARRQAGLGFGVGRPVCAANVAKLPRVAVAVDTSGSMTDSDDLHAAVSEVQGILTTLGAPTQFIACDTEITVGVVRSVADVAKLLKGGGGTEFTPIFDFVRQRKAFDLLVIFTDGYVNAPVCPPKLKVIWCITSQDGSPQFTAGEYGTIIRLKPSKPAKTGT